MHEEDPARDIRNLKPEELKARLELEEEEKKTAQAAKEEEEKKQADEYAALDDLGKI